ILTILSKHIDLIANQKIIENYRKDFRLKNPKRTLSEINKTLMRSSEYRKTLIELLIKCGISEETIEKLKENERRRKNKKFRIDYDNPAYSTIHLWIKKHKPKPIKCEICGKERDLEASNNDHKYSRNLDEWRWLCIPCHRNYDANLRNNQIQIENYIKIKV
ncbi:unnamed protein product, partial [marine sediment metagenome]